MTGNVSTRSRRAINVLYYAVALYFFAHLFFYYWTSVGGPLLLATTLVPITFILFTLNLLRENDLHPRLPALANYVIVAIYIVISVVVAVYMHVENYALGTDRAGMWNGTDMTLGALMALLVMEYARRRHMPLFVLNIILVLYAVYGWIVPGMFHHAGLEWSRVVTAMSVEMTTGVFSGLPQLALTVIGSFLLVLSVLRGYGCIDSLLRATKRVAVHSAHALPQSAVVGSMCVGTVSGSGAANAITIVGSIFLEIAIEQVVEIATAEQELQAKLEAAQQPVVLEELLQADDGLSQLAYHWASMLDQATGQPDPRLVGLARQAWDAARASGYAGPQ